MGWQQRSRQGVQIVTGVEIEAGQFRGEALVDPEFRIGIEGEYLVPGERNVQHTSAHAVVRVRELVELRIVIFAVPGQTAAKFQALVEKATADRQSGVSGKSVSVSVDLGGRRVIQK